MRHTIVADEEQLLSDVRTLLEEEPYEAPPRESDIVVELIRLREEMPNAKDEDKGALLEQYDRIAAILEQIRDSRDKPTVDPDSPYFAHIQLEESGKRRDVFLGKATRIQRGIRIVDWRNAPISRIFYRYQQGEEYEEELGNRIVEGEVVARRTLTINLGILHRIDAPEGTFRKEDATWTLIAPQARRLAGGEGSALRAHGAGTAKDRRLGTNLAGHRRRADKRLPDIAGLIDPEQFELITKPSSGFVVIRGTAGSGKTTVALHRIAWMAFSDPVINSPATMFVVFSPGLKDYIAHVLPSLGVPHVQVVDFRSWARRLRKAHFRALPNQIREDTPAVVIRLKLPPAVMVALGRQVALVNGPRTMEQAIDDWNSLFTRTELLQEVLEEIDPGVFTEADLAKVADWSRDRFDEILKWQEGDREVEASLDVEDDAILLRAWQLRVGPLRRKKRNVRFRHIAVDEVQDFTPIEVRVLMDCLDHHQSITLAGDTQQHVMKDAGFTSWAEFFGHLGLQGTAVNTLKVAYRSSKQVVDFSLKVLGDLREDTEPPLVTRDGPPVELFRFTDHGACVAFLSDVLNELTHQEPMASVAVLSSSSHISNMYFNGLIRGEVPRLRRVSQQKFTFTPGVEVTEIDQVKGLEFDYVILVEASAHQFPDTPSARRLLHVGGTRAVHQLWITTVGDPSPIIGEAMA
ncbi:MAG: ATP-binding domain-containing protein [Rhodobacterales bacterium]|nr:ATP-binding domain-containing protein [Rhodobacterales bacterium]